MFRRMYLMLLCVYLTFISSVRGSEWFPEIQGWEIEEYERIYNSIDLWELINGAAEGFLNYGFENLHLAEYVRNDEIVRVEIYNHRSPKNAYGMYSAERMPDYQQIRIGAQGYSSEGVVNFFTGPYYVKIMTIGYSDVDEKEIIKMAEQVDKHLDQSAQMPEVLSLFPEEGMEYLSDQYIASSFMGYSFLHSAFTARYNSNEDFQLFIIKSTTDEIQNMINQYEKVAEENQIRQKDDLFVLKDRFNGTVFLKEHDEYLIGVWDTDNEQIAADYIRAVEARLP